MQSRIVVFQSIFKLSYHSTKQIKWVAAVCFASLNSLYFSICNEKKLLPH